MVDSGENDVVDGDEDELDEVADGSHDQKADHARLQNLEILGTVWLLALGDKVLALGNVGHHLGVHVGLLFLLSFLGHVSLSNQALVVSSLAS